MKPICLGTAATVAVYLIICRGNLADFGWMVLMTAGVVGGAAVAVFLEDVWRR